ncbi:MAG TPA: Crp/Fnr family transcriptional regulator [Naasia sp.]|jgi:CRP-like cAMP-binding protein
MNWLQDLPEQERALFEARFLPRRFRRGETLVFQGDDSFSVGVIDAGHVSVNVATPHGERVTVTALGPGGTFGEIAQITRQGRTATLIALDDVKVRILPGAVFEEMRQRIPAIDRALLLALAARVDDLSARLAEAAYETVQRRCERRLVELSELFLSGDRVSAGIPLTQSDLAGVVGATRPTINQVLGALVDEGLVEVSRGRIDVPNVEALRRHAR